MNGVLENHLQSLEDYVLVEDKIVTYKWVSKVLKVHVNTAKQLLYAFTLKEEFDKKILVTYLIAGEGKNDIGVKYCLVKKEDVDNVKQSLKNVLSEHVYSIQRNSNFDAKNLYNADCSYELNEDDKKFCSIQKNEDIIKRCKVRENSVASNVENTKFTEKEAFSSYSEKKADDTKNSSECKSEITKSSNENAAETKRSISPIKGSTKISPTKSPNKTGTLKNKKSKNSTSKGPSIGTFFNKQAANAANKKKEVPTVVIDKEREESKENIGKVVNQSSESNRIKLENDEPKRTPPPPKKKENSRKRKKRDKDSESANKRRKRIVVASDSESSSDSETDNEELREPSPEPGPESTQTLPESDEEIIPPTPVEKKGRKRVRKQIDKTYQDEDGYILTKKEYVYESCSDDEVSSENKRAKEEIKKVETSNNMEEDNGDKKLKEVKVENNRNKAKKLKKSPKKTPPKNKQASIMNFFKRK